MHRTTRITALSLLILPISGCWPFLWEFESLELEDTSEEAGDCFSTWCTDADGDGWGDCDNGEALGIEAPTVSDCVGFGVPGDCDDTDELTHRDAHELCTGVDNDCDGLIDNNADDATHQWYQDNDGDGYPSDADSISACTDAPDDGYLRDDTLATTFDCDDNNAALHPNAFEWDDGVDENCSTEDDNTNWVNRASDLLVVLPAASDNIESISHVADLNRDGELDLIYGRDGESASQLENGATYVFLGPLTMGLELTDADYTLEGLSPGDQLGTAAVVLPDASGTNTLAVLAKGTVNTDDVGSVYLINHIAAASGNLDNAGSEWALPYTFKHEATLLAQGDVDGDDKPEVVVSLPFGASHTGELFVIETTGVGNFQAADSAAATISSSTGIQKLGTKLVVADITGDDVDDLIITDEADQVFIAHGPLASDEIATLADVTLSGSVADARHMAASLDARDVNGDGTADLIVGWTLLSQRGGAAIYYSGSLSTASADTDFDISVQGDFGSLMGEQVQVLNFDSDAFADIVIDDQLVLGPLLGTVDLSTTDADARVLANGSNGTFYQHSQAIDVNGDDRDDLVRGNVSYTGPDNNTVKGLGVIFGNDP